MSDADDVSNERLKEIKKTKGMKAADFRRNGYEAAVKSLVGFFPFGLKKRKFDNSTKITVW